MPGLHRERDSGHAVLGRLKRAHERAGGRGVRTRRQTFDEQRGVVRRRRTAFEREGEAVQRRGHLDGLFRRECEGVGVRLRAPHRPAALREIARRRLGLVAGHGPERHVHADEIRGLKRIRVGRIALHGELDDAPDRDTDVAVAEQGAVGDLARGYRDRRRGEGSPLAGDDIEGLRGDGSLVLDVRGDTGAGERSRQQKQCRQHPAGPTGRGESRRDHEPLCCRHPHRGQAVGGRSVRG